MAASRKLQGEIDRCLKKVSEGVEQFEDIWKKVYNATNSNQKEKYEADLKKEIKKLQRLRDQIKSWITSGEIKDKTILVENRKLIETQMERFKVVERETKTKAYSKEGLGAAQNKDPAQREKEDTTRWLSEQIDALNMQIEQFESESESLMAATKKKKNVDHEKTRRLEQLRNLLERHRYHIKKLEILMRMLNNESVEVNSIKKIKDDVEYYVEYVQEPDFMENEGIYDDFDMEDHEFTSAPEVSIGKVSKGSHDSTEGSTPASSVCGSSPAPSPANHSTEHNDNVSAHQEKKKSTKEESRSNRSASQNSTPVKPQVVRPQNSSSSITNHSSSKSSNIPLTPTKPITGSTSQSTPNNSSSSSGLTNHLPSPLQHTRDSNHSNSILSHNSVSNVPAVSSHASSNGPNLTSHCNIPTTQALTVQSSKSITCSIDQGSSLKVIAAKKLDEVNVVQRSSASGSNTTSLAGNCGTTVIVASNCTSTTINSVLTTSSPNISSDEIVIPPLLGVAPLGSVRLNTEHKMQYERLQAAFFHMPHPSDSERFRMHFPRQPCQTPEYYPQVAPHMSDTVEFFQRLSTETLFFIFYYMEGTKAQYLAAKALKKQSWRFHTKYMMWFQRHEEPKAITDEFEQGTYIFFDCENWGQRKKENFIFEYKYLEDRDLN